MLSVQNLEVVYQDVILVLRGISFDIPKLEFVTLRIFNLLGQDVKTLSSKIMNPGRYTFEWDGKDLLSNDVASGVYFYELRGESFISRKKMLLIR